MSAINEQFVFPIDINDHRRANLYRHALSFLEVYAIKYVKFDRVNCCRQEEVIAITMGQIPIWDSKVDPDQLEFPFTVVGPTEFTSADIPGLPIMFPVPIFQLGADEFIKGSVILERGNAATHARWKAVSTVAIAEKDEGYELTIGTVGVLTPDEIRARIEEGIQPALKQEPVAKFFALSRPRL